MRLLFITYALAYHIGCGPSGLEIEPSCDTINIEHLACKKEVRTAFALQCIRIDSLWAGLTCLGDATIVLADGTTNTVKNFNRKYPCIHAAEGKTLVIKGDYAFRPIGASTFHYVSNKYGQIYFDDNEIISDIEQYDEASSYYYDPEDGFYGALLFVKTTQILGDKDQQPGDEDIYYNNTWTLTPKC